MIASQIHSPTYCVETHDLTHKFSEDETALDLVNLQVIEGSIYGFLGPNGAGKTTSLKLILGLLKKQRGEISVFGKPLEHNRVEILRRIGSMIESPSIYAHLTAVENLRVWHLIYQCRRERIDEVLKLVGLASTGSKKAGQFSLGMKQRLSIAIALLHEPTLLILDEPTNGLDPNGILEIRELLQVLNKQQGITILISSHLLSEIEKLVSHVGIIHKGRMLFQGTLVELIDKQRRSSLTVFETNDPDKTFRVMSEFGEPSHCEADKVAMQMSAKGEVAEIANRLVSAGVEIYQIQKSEHDLEQIFFDVIK